MSGAWQEPIRNPKHTEAPIVLRRMRTDASSASRNEQGHVINTWVKSSYGRTCTGRPHEQGMWRLAKALIQVCDVTLAVDEQNTDSIFGWCCSSGADIVHYVWVDQSMRKNGISRDLLDPFLTRTGIIYTHSPALKWQYSGADDKYRFNLNSFKEREKGVPIPIGWTFNPFLAYELAACVPGYARETMSVQSSAPAPSANQHEMANAGSNYRR